MRIKEMPFFNRPGFKLVKKGANYLDDAELLAILFDRGDKYNNAIEIANKILNKYNLNGLVNLGFSELKNEFNGDSVKAMKILSLIELSKRYNKLIKNGFTNRITSAEDVFNMFVDRLRDEKKEHFIVLYLDVKNNIIKEEAVSIGILDSALIHPREIFKTAIKESAYAIILVHNHPSGDCEPSKKDIEVTKQLVKASKILDIKILDHIIIGENKWWSWRENKFKDCA